MYKVKSSPIDNRRTPASQDWTASSARVLDQSGLSVHGGWNASWAEGSEGKESGPSIGD